MPSGTSANWSGHITVPEPGKASKLSYTTATWKVPRDKAHIGVADAKFWAGLGGLNGQTLMQAGVTTDEVWIPGVGDSSPHQVSYIWWETYGIGLGQVHPVALVSPDDTITASVAYNGGKNYTMKVTVNGSVRINVTEPAAQAGYPGSAEVIVESPLPASAVSLADFGTVTFSNVAYRWDSGGKVYGTAILVAQSAHGKPETAVSGATGTWTVKFLRSRS
jgi:hypothetical protein